MVLMDNYTKYPVVEIILSKAFSKVMLALEKIFAMLGLPEEIKTDNGPLFQGQEFMDFLASLGIHHRKITPLWPQANGEVERFMCTLNKAIRIGVDQGEDAECCIHRFLRAYRQTQHSTTRCAPIDLLMRRPTRDSIPMGSS